MQSPFFFASHSIEALSKKLAEQLESRGCLFAPPLIVIPHPSMKEWLQLDLCRTCEKKAVVGLEFVSWTQALQILGGPLPVPNRLELSAALWAAESNKSPNYVSQLTDVFAQFVEGFSFVEPEEAHGFHEIMQAHAWKTYPEAIKKIASSRQVILFAIDFLPPPIHQFFLSLPSLQVYRFSPCAMYWEDFRSAGERKNILRKWEQKGVSDNRLYDLDELLRDSQRLLANWGMIGRKMLVECEMETAYEWTGEYTLLNALKVDLLFLERPTVKFLSTDRSIQCVKTGSSRFQEIQWLNEEIHRLVSKGLQFSEIRVYAPDISVYAPIIEFTFDSIPFRIASVDLARQSGFYQAILQMFRCVSGRWEASYILELFQRPVFHRKMKWQQDEIARMREWIKIGRVRWGIDAVHKNETTAVEGAIRDAGSWERGWDAMLNSLIYLQPEKESVIGWGEIDLFEQFYELFYDLQKTLLSWREEKTLHHWADEIEALIKRTLEIGETGDTGHCDEKLEADLVAKSSFRQFIEGLRKTARSFPVEKFPFSWVETHFYSTSSEEGRSLVNAVRFTSLTPGTLVPAKALFLIGMDEESFPRLHTSSPLQNKLKDVPRPTDFDRYMFLQAIFCAKEKLFFTYGDSSKEDGKAMSPSLLLQELFCYLDNTFAFEDEKKPSEILIAKGKIREPAITESHSLLENTRQIPELLETSETISIQELAKFFRHPLQYYLKQVLGIELSEEPESAWKDFELSALDRHFFLRNSLTQDDVDFEMPIGMFGDLAKKNLDQDVEQFQEHLQSWGIDPASISTRSLSGNLRGEVPYCVPEGILHLGADDIGGLFRKWPELLAALVANNATKIFCLRSGKVREITDPASALQRAIDLFVRCRKSPCVLHGEWADALLRKKVAPEMDQIKDRVLRWIIQRSPALDFAHEQKIWQDTWAETFSALTALFPMRGQHAEV